jgi:hypothetical protein
MRQESLSVATGVILVQLDLQQCSEGYLLPDVDVKQPIYPFKSCAGAVRPQNSKSRLGTEKAMSHLEQPVGVAALAEQTDVAGQ